MQITDLRSTILSGLGMICGTVIVLISTDPDLKKWAIEIIAGSVGLGGLSFLGHTAQNIHNSALSANPPEKPKE